MKTLYLLLLGLSLLGADRDSWDSHSAASGLNAQARRRCDEQLAEHTAAVSVADHPPDSVRFNAVDVYVDSGDKPLAAYQFEVKAQHGEVLLVGLEGGEPAAFRTAPYYDPSALLQNKVIVAAFSTAPQLPHGRTRVARLMVQVSGPNEPVYDATLSVAGSTDGKPIPNARLSIAS